MPSPENTAPFTVVVSRRVLKGSESEFEMISSEMTKAASDFNGHLGATMFRPSTPEDPEYRVVFKFEDRDTLDQWLGSNIRKAYIEKIEKLLEAPSKMETLSSLEPWFTLPGRTPVRPPPRYKMAVTSWLALFPIVTIIFFVAGDFLERIPLLPRVALVTGLVIIVMTWIAMPALTKFLSGWLYPASSKQVR